MTNDSENKIVIQVATESDLPACAELMKGEKTLEYAPGICQTLPEFRENFQAGGLFLVAKHEGRIIGFINGYITIAKLAFLDNVSVSEQFRGLGIGSMLIKGFEEAIKKQDANMLWLITDPSSDKNAQFYQKNGYQKGHNFTLYIKDLL